MRYPAQNEVVRIWFFFSFLFFFGLSLLSCIAVLMVFVLLHLLPLLFIVVLFVLIMFSFVGPIDISDIYMLSDVLFSFRCPFPLFPGSLTLQFFFDCPHSDLFPLSSCLVIYPSLKVIE